MRNALKLILFSDSGPRIVLTGSSISEAASVGDLVGNLSVQGGSGSYTFTITTNTYFDLDGVDTSRVEVKAALDYETATSHQITVQAVGTGNPPPRTFRINVSSVAVGGSPSLDFSDPDNSQYLGVV